MIYKNPRDQVVDDAAMKEFAASTASARPACRRWRS